MLSSAPPMNVLKKKDNKVINNMPQIVNKLINTMYYFTCHKFMSTSLIVRNMATVKRFYRRTNILSSGDKFEVILDQRKLKTPQGKIFEVNSKPLALAVAAEWDAQKETIDRGSMHLTSLCNTVLDNPYNRTKIDLVNHIVNCLEMDTILFYSNEVDELYQLQVEKWEPIVLWFCKHYDIDIARTQSIETPTVSMETKAALTRHLLSHNFNSIYGLVYAVDGLKSVILTLATVERVINIPEAVNLSRLEEEYQISHWGNVEWHHEYSKQDLQARLSAAMLFVYLNSHSATSRPKHDASNRKSKASEGKDMQSTSMVQMEAQEMEQLLKSHLRENNLLQDESKWIIDRSSLGGRGIFATRDIRAGELIFTDVPLLIGPRCYNKYPPMCIVCYKSNCALFPCDHGCGLPICSTECENSAMHVQGECRFLKEWAPICGSTWSKDLLLAVVPIRGLTLSKEQRKLLYAFECHVNLTRNYELDLLKKNVANLPSEKQIELMRRICDVFNTNSFEVVVVSSRDKDCTTSLRGLYPMGALQNHCCVPNTRHHFDDQQRLHVSAVLPIIAGEEITMSYTDLLWDTSSRRQFLRVTKGFSCNCNRCSDPLEFGSQLGVLLCAKDDCSGHLLPRNPLNHQSSWMCNKCQITMNHRQIECIRSGLNTFVSDAMYKTPREILRFIEAVLSKLIPVTNYLMLDVKYRIISYFGRVSDLKWEDLTDAELKIKKMYCDDILSTLDILDSGDSIKKGLVLYELYRTNLELFKRQIFDNDEQTHLHIKNNDNERLLRKAMSILKNDVGAACIRKND